MKSRVNINWIIWPCQNHQKYKPRQAFLRRWRRQKHRPSAVGTGKRAGNVTRKAGNALPSGSLTTCRIEFKRSSLDNQQCVQCVSVSPKTSLQASFGLGLFYLLEFPQQKSTIAKPNLWKDQLAPRWPKPIQLRKREKTCDHWNTSEKFQFLLFSPMTGWHWI